MSVVRLGHILDILTF